MTIIVSIGENNEIGRSGDLCWHIREDLRHFKAITMGHPVIMGRKTWQSLPKKPLPGRLNIVISSQSIDFDGDGLAIAARGLEEALEIAGQESKAAGMDAEPFIIGGASIYARALPKADRLEITRILASDPEADTFFPLFSEEEWRLADHSDTFKSESGVEYRYETWLRRPAREGK